MARWADEAQTTIVIDNPDGTQTFVPDTPRNRVRYGIGVIDAFIPSPADDSPQVVGDMQHRGELLAFHGRTPTPQQVVTEITAQSLFNALVAKGLIEDGTS